MLGKTGSGEAASRFLVTVCLLICFGLLSSVASAQLSPRDIATAMNQQWIRFHDTSDAAGLTGLYTTDAILCPPGTASPFVGQAQILQYYSNLLLHPAQALVIQETEAHQVNETTIIHAGTWHEEAEGKPITGLYVTVLLKQDNDWKIAADTWNSN